MMDRIVYRFFREWEAPGLNGLMCGYSTPETFTDPARARTTHETRCAGRLDDGTWWVTRQMRRPMVSAIEVVRNGMVLRDHLAPAKDLPDFAQAAPSTSKVPL